MDRKNVLIHRSRCATAIYNATPYSIAYASRERVGTLAGWSSRRFATRSLAVISRISSQTILHQRDPVAMMGSGLMSLATHSCLVRSPSHYHGSVSALPKPGQFGFPYSRGPRDPVQLDHTRLIHGSQRYN